MNNSDQIYAMQALTTWILFEKCQLIFFKQKKAAEKK